MQANNFWNFLTNLYGQFGYEVTFAKNEIYKGCKYNIKVNGVSIGMYTVYDDDIGGGEYYEGCIAGHKLDFVTLIFSDPNNINNRSIENRSRGDYNVLIPFP